MEYIIARHWAKSLLESSGGCSYFARARLKEMVKKGVITPKEGIDILHMMKIVVFTKSC